MRIRFYIPFYVPINVECDEKLIPKKDLLLLNRNFSVYDLDRDIIDDCKELLEKIKKYEKKGLILITDYESIAEKI